MTKPTREQQRAAELLAGALLTTTKAARLDGRAAFAPTDLKALLALLTRASSAFPAEAIVARALEARALELSLPPGTTELLTLLDTVGDPLQLLLLDDPGFRRVVEEAEQALG